MSYSRRIVAAMATLAVLVAAPATASAAQSSSKVPSSANVQVHVDKATKAVKRMKRYARLGDNRSVAKHLKIARTQSAAASKMARSMATTADPGTQSIAAARALTLAGTQYDALAETITAIVDQITGQVQALVANAIGPSLAGKQKIVEVLTQLLDQVPAEAKPMIASIIAALSVGDANEIVNMNDALNSGALPVNIAGIVSSAMSMATGIMDQAFGIVQSILPMLPAVVQGPIAQVLKMVTSVVGTIVPSVLQTVTGLIDTILGSLPFVGGTSASAGGLFGLGGLLDGILGGGSQSLPGNIGSMLDGLLGSLFGGGSNGGGTAPSTGIIGGVTGIIGSVTGLIGNLLGGLFGGSAVPAT
jgi:hypothetical protein